MGKSLLQTSNKPEHQWRIISCYNSNSENHIIRQELSNICLYIMIDVCCVQITPNEHWIHLLTTWLHALDYHNFGTMKDDILSIDTLASNKCLFTGTFSKSRWRLLFLKNGEPFFAKKLKILNISYHTILLKFHQHVVQILIK